MINYSRPLRIVISFVAGSPCLVGIITSILPFSFAIERARSFIHSFDRSLDSMHFCLFASSTSTETAPPLTVLWHQPNISIMREHRMMLQYYTIYWDSQRGPVRHVTQKDPAHAVKHPRRHILCKARRTDNNGLQTTAHGDETVGLPVLTGCSLC